TGAPSSQVIAYPGFANGSIEIRAVSANFWETHVDLSEKAIDDGWFRLYSLLGYRYYRYDESLRARQIIDPTNRNFIAGTQIVSADNFNVRNEFHGIDLGLRTQFIWDRFTLDVLTKLAVGRINRAVNINGEQTITTPGFAPITRDGGVLALGSNSGLSATGDWKVVPEAGLNLNWQVLPNLNMRFGYSFLLLNGIARVADKVDTTINPNFFPGGSGAGIVHPANNNVRSDLWIQSINVGVLWSY
ncbi:MAG: BBP7 family outer membrane beta-barrel protein, partial [Planctomycetes bacterium]|nr:BBP7 family outer membrane beta-barrel protein [Planctomycetota bacterium]